MSISISIVALRKIFLREVSTAVRTRAEILNLAVSRNSELLRVDSDPAMRMLCTSRLGVRAPIEVFNGHVCCHVIVPMSLRCQFRCQFRIACR
jgi:hypothetical protein